MTWLELAAVLAVLVFLLGGLAYATAYGACWIYALWRRWRIERRWSSLDRISMEAIARMGRKP